MDYNRTFVENTASAGPPYTKFLMIFDIVALIALSFVVWISFGQSAISFLNPSADESTYPTNIVHVFQEFDPVSNPPRTRFHFQTPILFFVKPLAIQVTEQRTINNLNLIPSENPNECLTDPKLFGTVKKWQTDWLNSSPQASQSAQTITLIYQDEVPGTIPLSISDTCTPSISPSVDTQPSG
jgi:hypothetical protein